MTIKNTNFIINRFQQAIKLISTQESVLKSDDYKALLCFLEYMLEQLKRVNLASPYNFYSDIHSANRSFFEAYAYFSFIIEYPNEIHRRLAAYQSVSNRDRCKKILALFETDNSENAPKMQNNIALFERYYQSKGITRDMIAERLEISQNEIDTSFKPIGNHLKPNKGKKFYSLDGGPEPINNFRDLCTHLNLDFIYSVIMHEESTEVHASDVINSFKVSENGTIKRNVEAENTFTEHFITRYFYDVIKRTASLKGISSKREINKCLLPVKNKLRSWQLSV